MVSYQIDTDLGYKTMRHHRFLKPLAAEHDPRETKKSNKFVTQPIEMNTGSEKIYTQTNLEALNDDTAAESGSDITEEIGKSRAPRRSDRIKRDREITGATRIRVKKVSTTDSLNMGGSCSSQLTEEAHIKLYEAGITDSSMHEMHSSQTNIGLLNVGTENSSNGCDCSSTSI